MVRHEITAVCEAPPADARATTTDRDWTRKPVPPPNRSSGAATLVRMLVGPDAREG
jgi:hypothetical protein